MRRPDQFDPFAPVTIWRSTDCRDEADALPYFRHDWDALLDQCRTAVDRREAAYPQLVREGRLDSDLARSDLAAWRLLEAEWTWIISGIGEAPALHSLDARKAAVELAIERVETELERRRTDDLLGQWHLLSAIGWHLGDGRAAPAIHHTARLNHTLGRARPVSEPVEATRKAA